MILPQRSAERRKGYNPASLADAVNTQPLFHYQARPREPSQFLSTHGERSCDRPEIVTFCNAAQAHALPQGALVRREATEAGPRLFLPPAQPVAARTITQPPPRTQRPRVVARRVVRHRVADAHDALHGETCARLLLVCSGRAMQGPHPSRSLFVPQPLRSLLLTRTDPRCHGRMEPLHDVALARGRQPLVYVNDQVWRACRAGPLHTLSHSSNCILRTRRATAIRTMTS